MSGLLERLLSAVLALPPATPPVAPRGQQVKAPATSAAKQVKASVPTGKTGACVADCPLAHGAPFVSTTYKDYKAEVGNGYCVPYVQQAANVGLTKTWKPGADLVDRPDIAAGTAIATFDDDDVYPSNSSGNHAAIFDGYGKENDREGFYVYDQYREWGPKPAEFDKLPAERQAEVAASYGHYDESKKRYYNVKAPGRRFIRFDNPPNPSNNGNAYSVIEH